MMELEDSLFTMGKPKNEPTFSIDIEVVKDDITKREVDVIVNAAHDDLTGGGGVDGAIHKAAGQKLLGECLHLYGCTEGEVRITNGYDLPAKYIIHTVGPVWSPNKEKQEQAKEDLAKCYSNALTMAEMQGMKSIAFPCISTGAYCFPKELASEIAIKTIYKWFHNYVGHVKNKDGCYLDKVEIVCFADKDVDIYRKAVANEEDDRTLLKCNRNDGAVCVYVTSQMECRRPKDKNCIREKYDEVEPIQEETDGCEDHLTCFDCQDGVCEGHKSSDGEKIDEPDSD